MAGGGQLFYIFVSHREESARDSHDAMVISWQFSSGFLLKDGR